MYAARAEEFAGDILPGLASGIFHHVQHHTAHAASAYLAAPFGDCAVLVLDGRGEVTSHLAGVVRDGKLEKLAAQVLPQSVGLLYEEVTAHLGFRRSSDEFKVMALASYGIIGATFLLLAWMIVLKWAQSERDRLTRDKAMAVRRARNLR